MLSAHAFPTWQQSFWRSSPGCTLIVNVCSPGSSCAIECCSHLKKRNCCRPRHHVAAAWGHQSLDHPKALNPQLLGPHQSIPLLPQAPEPHHGAASGGQRTQLSLQLWNHQHGPPAQCLLAAQDVTIYVVPDVQHLVRHSAGSHPDQVLILEFRRRSRLTCTS